MKFIYWFILFLSIGNVFGQEQFTLNSSIFDANTKLPLAYASISIINRPVGTISNASGEFTFYFSKKYLNDTLIISSLGYQPFKKLVSELFQEPIPAKFELTPTKIQLMEFVVSNLSANEVVKKALQNIPKNYPSKPYLLKGFYRHYRNENSQCVDLIETAIVLKDYNYSAPYKVRKNDNKAQYLKRYRKAPVRENVYVQQFRRSNNNQSFYKEFFFNNNMIIETLRNNRVKYRNFELDPNLNQYHFAGQISENNKTIYIITTAEIGGAQIYIDATSYAIVKLENIAPWTGHYLFQHKVKNYEKATERERAMRITLEFQEYNNKMYLKYLDYSWSYEIYSEEKQKIMVIFDVNNLLVINEVIEHPQKKDYENLVQMNKHKRLEEFNWKYNPDFWTHYNLVQKNPLDNKSSQDLEKKVPLNEQFKHPIQNKEKK